MRGALDFFGLAGVLFAILVVGPFLKSYTEGFATTPTPEEQKKLEEEVKAIGTEIVNINKLLENPSLQPETKETMLKQKEELQAKIQKLSGVPLPPDTIPAAVQASNPSDLDKKKSATEGFQTFR